MVETAEKKPEQEQDDPRKQGDVKVQMSVPVMHAESALGFLGLGGQGLEETPVRENVEAQSTDPETEGLFEDAHPEDVEALKQKMAESGRPMPEGASIPESASQMPSRYRSMNPVQAPGRPPQPAGQAGIPQFTGGSGGLPSQREAFEYSMKTPPPIQTKKEFEAGRESPSWWRMMLADFAGGAPGAGREEMNARMDKAYQESIQRQMQDRSEFERKQAIVGQYAVEPGDEMVKVPLWEGGPEIEMERKNLGQAMPLFTRRAEQHYKKGEEVSLREMFGGDTTVPDLKMDRDVAIEYGKFIIQRKAQGLDKERDWLYKYDRPTWDALQKSDLKRAKALAKIKREEDDIVTQVPPSAEQESRELFALMPIDEYGGIEQFSPQLSDYVDSVTLGSDEPSKQHMLGLAKNIHMMNHTKYKSTSGALSKNHDHYKRELDENGWYFMGERIPNNKRAAERKLRVLKTSDKVNDVQMQAFMNTHFGAFDRSFEARAPEELAYMTETAGKKPSIALPYDPESVEMEGVSEGAAGGGAPSAAEMSVGSGAAAAAIRMSRATGGEPTPLPDQPKINKPLRPLAPDEIGENAAMQYGKSLGWTPEQTRREFAKDKFKIVPGR